MEKIKEEDEIENAQNLFAKILQYGIDKLEGKRKIGTGPKNYIECDVYWSPELKFWSASCKKERKIGNKYFNCIGFKEPPKETEKYFLEDVNINFSKTDKTSGKFVKDGNKTYLAHNGVLGGNRKNKDDIAAFMKYYRERNNNVEIKEIDNENLLLISKLPSDEKEYSDFQDKFIAFTKEINEVNKKTGKEKARKKKEEETANGEIGNKGKQKPNDKKKMANPVKKQPENKKEQKLNHFQNHTNSSEEDISIDNVIIVKIGLRTLAKLLIPCVPEKLEYVFGNNWRKKDDVLKHLSEVQKDELTKERLDLSVCLSLIDSHWEVFKKLLPKEAYPRKVRSWINELKDDRNINAHDGIEDISYDDALRVLDTISRLCDTFGPKNNPNKIKDTVNRLKKYLKNP